MSTSTVSLDDPAQQRRLMLGPDQNVGVVVSAHVVPLERSAIRLLDILVWTAHPVASLRAPLEWRVRLRRDAPERS